MDRQHRERMAYFDKGLISKKGVYFHTPSSFARQNLFCILWGAEFLCDVSYEIHRKIEKQFMDSCIIFRILEGKLHFEYRGTTFTAHPGNIVLLDSRIPNHYWASEQVRFQYVHFNGNLASSYAELLFEQHGACHIGRTESGFLFKNILEEMSQTSANDHKLSLWMYNLIAGLALPQVASVTPAILRAQQYMDANFQKSLTVEEIASYATLSQYHFSRLFKQETGFSPHHYLMNLRLKHARELLSVNTASIDAIGLTCGFSNTSHFIYAFKKEIGVTPNIFRKYFDYSGFRP